MEKARRQPNSIMCKVLNGGIRLNSECYVGLPTEATDNPLKGYENSMVQVKDMVVFEPIWLEGKFICKLKKAESKQYFKYYVQGGKI